MIVGAGLREKDLRAAILGTLLEAGRPVSHNELMADARLGDADRVTVYRNLTILKDADLVHTVQGTDGVWRFCAHDTNIKGCPGGHAHLYCTECKRMICLKDQRIPVVEVPEGFRVEGKQLVVYGICSDCASEIA